MNAAYEGETYAVVGAFVDELVRSGVVSAVVSPGSRSTPLALALARRPEIRLYVHPDERSAAYFGLGLAKAPGRPVALVCTSGTAAANYLPAVVEARYARVPLVVLTADRPPELRDVAAPQTIDQVRMFGSHAKWSVDLPPPAPLEAVVRQARVVADRAVALSLAPPQGPVHVNVPLREPLVPQTSAAPPPGFEAPPWRGRPDGLPYARVWDQPPAPDPGHARRLGAELAQTARGVVVCGPEPGDGPERALARARAAARFARRLGWPLLADPLSAARTLGEAVTRYDAFLRSDAVRAALAPERAVRIGAPPVSKALGELLDAMPEGALAVVDDGGGYPDPSLRAGDVVHADPEAWLRAAAAAAAPAPGADAWRTRWREAEGAAAAATAEAMLRTESMFEGRILHELARLVPPAATVVVGNSMAVRDADAFFHPRGRGVRVLGNRGASGIDGVVSTALGAAAAAPGRPCLMVLGDLSFFHDLGGLVAARRFGLGLTAVVADNDGGGIFSFLPQRRHGERFEELFGTPLGLDIGPAVGMHGGRVERVRSWRAFRAAVRRGLGGEGLTVVAVAAPSREENVRLHEALWQEVARAVETALEGAVGI